MQFVAAEPGDRLASATTAAKKSLACWCVSITLRPRRKRESQRRVNGCKTARCRLHARRLERTRAYEASILLVAWR
jgi:hypothetical protein